MFLFLFILLDFIRVGMEADITITMAGAIIGMVTLKEAGAINDKSLRKLKRVITEQF